MFHGNRHVRCNAGIAVVVDGETADEYVLRAGVVETAANQNKPVAETFFHCFYFMHDSNRADIIRGFTSIATNFLIFFQGGGLFWCSVPHIKSARETLLDANAASNTLRRIRYGVPVFVERNRLIWTS